MVYFKFSFMIYLVAVLKCIFPACFLYTMYMQVPVEARSEFCICWLWTYAQLISIIEVLQTKPGFPARTSVLVKSQCFIFLQEYCTGILVLS